VRGAGRGWTATAAAVGVSAAVVVPVLALLAARTLGDSTTGTLDVPPSTTARPAETPGALLMAVDETEVVGLTAFALAPSGAGGTAVVIPAGSLAPVDGFERPTRLAAAYTQAGFGGQVTATEGLLGVTFSVAEQVDEAGMKALFAPLEPIPVDLPDPVVRTAPDGTVLMQLPAGPQELTAAQAAAVLFTRVANETEYVRLPDQIAVWTGVVAVSDRVAAPATEEAPTDVAGFLAAIGAGSRTVVSLTVTPALDVVTNPEGIDLLEVDTVDMRILMARILPTAASPTGSGLRVRLVNGTGDADALYEATARLQFVGADVVAVDDGADGTTAAESSLRFDPSLTREQVDTLTLAVGPVVATPATERIDGVDVTLELGQDFLAFLRAAAAEAAAQAVSSTAGVATTAPAG
jgi:hypothetical protein